MFSSRSKDTQTDSPAVSPAAMPRRAGGRSVPSIISGDLHVTGTLNSSGDLQVDGKVDGDIIAASLVIGEKALVKGEIVAEEAVIRGRIEGSIRARKVQLCSTCHVEGNILHEALAVEAGAFFEGNCRHSDNPLGDAPAKPAAPSKPAEPLSPAAIVGSAPRPAAPKPNGGLGTAASPAQPERLAPVGGLTRPAGS